MAISATASSRASIRTVPEKDEEGKNAAVPAGTEGKEELQRTPSKARGTQSVREDTDVAPDGGYGWVCVACVFWVNAATWGVNSSYSVYLAHYLSGNAFPGATPLQYAFIAGLSLSQAMFIAPLGTFLNRLYSTRVVMAIGVVAEVGSLVASSFATKMWHLILSEGVLFGWGMGLLFISSVGVTSQWFTRKRSLANGIVSAGSGIGGLIFSLGTRAMIANLGTAWAFRITAACAFVLNAVGTLLIRDRNKHINPSQRAFDVALLRRAEFWLVLLWTGFTNLGYTIILFSLPDFASSRGFSSQQGSVLSALLSLGMAFGRPLVGFASDRFGRLNCAGVASLITGIACFAIWLPAKTFGVSILFSLVAGTVCGTMWGVVAPVTAEVVGIKDLPSGLNLVWLGAVLPVTFAEAIGLCLRKPGTSNPYLHAQIFAGLMYLAAAACNYLLRTWKIADNDRKEQEKLNTGSSSGEKDAGTWLSSGAEAGTAQNGEGELIKKWKQGGKWWRYAAV